MNLNDQKIEKLKQIMEKAPDVGKVIFAGVDPDAIGSAVLATTVAQSYGKRISGIFYSGDFNDPQNELIFNEFDLHRYLRPIEEMPDDGFIILVDSSAVEDSRFPNGRIPQPTIIIDHHRSEIKETDDNWIWIEPWGAASTLVALLIKKLSIQLPDDEGKTATLGALGISSDTDAIRSRETCKEDREAYNFLMEYGRQELIAKVSNFDYPKKFFKISGRAFRNHWMAEGATLVTTVGYLKDEEEWMLARCADRLIRADGVEMVIVWAIVEKKLVIKARAADLNRDLYKRLTRLFPGHNAGAKKRSGGATVPLETFFDNPIFNPTTRVGRKAFLAFMIEKFKELLPFVQTEVEEDDS